MTLKDFLEKKRADILSRWLDRIFEIYPRDSKTFFKENLNPFSNPIGSTIREGIEGLYQGILAPIDPSRVKPFLEAIIRIRAVEDLSPSQAVAFVPLLKGVIREVLGDKIRDDHFYEDLLKVEERIDQLTLQAFDLYMECREKIYQLKVRELKGRMGSISEKIT